MAGVGFVGRSDVRYFLYTQAQSLHEYNECGRAETFLVLPSQISFTLTAWSSQSFVLIMLSEGK